MKEWIVEFPGFAEAWFQALARASWQGGWALALVWVGCRARPQMSPRIQCWLWRLAYLKLCVAFLWATPIDLPVLPASSAAEPLPSPVPGVTPKPTEPGPSAPVGSRGLSDGWVSPPAPSSWSLCLFLLWLLGGGWWSVKLAREWRLTKQLRRAMEPVEEEAWSACCRELSQRFRFRVPPQLRTTPNLGSPLALGGFRSVIALPFPLLGESTRMERRLLLAHEMAHLKRGDWLWEGFRRVLQGWFFFHPLVWLTQREWRLAQEMACDEWAVQTTQAPRRDYGRLLLKVAAPNGSHLPSGLATMRGEESYLTLRRRLKAMQYFGPFSRRRGIISGLVLAGLGILCLVPWRATAGGPQETIYQVQFRLVTARPQEGIKLTTRPNYCGQGEDSGKRLATIPVLNGVTSDKEFLQALSEGESRFDFSLASKGEATGKLHQFITCLRGVSFDLAITPAEPPSCIELRGGLSVSDPEGSAGGTKLGNWSAIVEPGKTAIVFHIGRGGSLSRVSTVDEDGREIILEEKRTPIPPQLTLLVTVSRGSPPAGRPGTLNDEFLASWPSDAPLQLRPRRGPTALNYAQAEQQARRFLGVDETKPLQMFRAYLTDRDFPFLNPRDLPVWVAVVRNLLIPPSPQRTPEREAGEAVKIPCLYLALDAENGQCIEAFTPPQRSWWHEILVVGKPHEDHFRETGQVFEQPITPPLLTVKETLPGLITREEAAGQLKLWHVRYSNYHSGRSEGNRFIPVAIQRPAWVVVRAGIQIRPTGPSPLVGRAISVRDAETGERIVEGSYGSRE